MSLTKQIVHAIDKVFQEEDGLRGFQLLDAKDGISFRRYLKRGTYSDWEVSIHRSKWWTARGGEVFGELYCFVPEAQFAVFGVQQSWLTPAQGVRLFHFQFRTSGDGSQFEQSVGSAADLPAFEQGLRHWLSAAALPWLQQFERRQGMLDYLEGKEDSYHLALLQAYFGEWSQAKQSTAKFIAVLPREIEERLRTLRERGLLSEDDARYLLKASIQSNEEYAQRVQKWSQKQGA